MSTVSSDSYMAMILPDDMPERISQFIAGRKSFPLVESGELMCLMYIYGKAGGVANSASASPSSSFSAARPSPGAALARDDDDNHNDIGGNNHNSSNDSDIQTAIADVGNFAERTAAQMSRDIESYNSSSAGRLDSEYIRSKIVNRQLQMAVEKKDNIAQRVSSDPAVVSDCFAQHVSYYKQDYFFGLYGPLKESELTSDIRQALGGRMVMVCYNRKGSEETGLAHPLIPVYVWFRDQAAGAAKPQ